MKQSIKKRFDALEQAEQIAPRRATGPMYAWVD
jgi:hypothetical protein